LLIVSSSREAPFSSASSALEIYGPCGIEGGVGGAAARQATVAGAIAKICFNLVMRMTSIPFTKYDGTA
jgi:hypothetical protein